jgi:hypothetical protein
MKVLKTVLNVIAAFCLGAVAGCALDALMVFFVFTPKYFFRFAYKWYWLMAALPAAASIAGVLLEIWGGKIKGVSEFRGSVLKKAGAAFITILLCVLSVVAGVKIRDAMNFKYKTFISGISAALSNAVKDGENEIKIENRPGAEYIIFSRAYAILREKLLLSGFPYSRAADMMEAAVSMNDGSMIFIIKNGVLTGTAVLPGNLSIADENGNGFIIVKAGNNIKIFLRKNSRGIFEIYRIE